MEERPGTILRVIGTWIILVLFSVNLIAAWKDPLTPYWIFNCIVLGILCYLLNRISCCFNDEPMSNDLLGSYPFGGYGAISINGKDLPPSYSSLGVELEMANCLGKDSIDQAAVTKNDRDSSTLSIAGSGLESLSNGLPSFQNAVTRTNTEGYSDTYV